MFPARPVEREAGKPYGESLKLANSLMKPLLKLHTNTHTHVHIHVSFV